MGLERAIEHGKEKRKLYRDSRAFDHSCRNHKGCPWCEGNRLHRDRREEERTKKELEQFKVGSQLISLFLYIFRVEEKNIDYEQVQDQLQEPSGQAGKYIR